MSIFSVLRGASYLARDIMSALRRMASPPDDDNPDAYADHLARLHADALAEREAREEVAEPLGDCGLGEADECLCDPDGGLSCDECEPSPSAGDEIAEWLASIDASLAAIHDHLTSAAPGPFSPDAAAESPAPPVPEAGAGHPNLPWCAAEMNQVAEILLTTDSPFALGYANDLRFAAQGSDALDGWRRELWPWSGSDRRK